MYNNKKMLPLQGTDQENSTQREPSTCRWEQNSSQATCGTAIFHLVFLSAVVQIFYHFFYQESSNIARFIQPPIIIQLLSYISIENNTSKSCRGR